MGTFDGIELDEVELAGDRLVLRAWRPDDAGAVHAIMQDRSMYEFLALPDPYTREVADRYVTDIGHEGRGSGTGLGCAVVEAGTGAVVGSAAVRHLDAAPDIGYWIAPSARGRGYATEATCLLADWAFAHGVHRIELLCEITNLASVVTALNSGFAYEGVARQHSSAPSDRAARAPRLDVARFGRLATDPGAPIEPRFPRLRPGEITDGVISVRPMQPRDAEGWRELERDPVTVQGGFTSAPPDDAALAQTPRQAGLEWLVGTSARMTIEDVGTGRFAGSVQLRYAGPPQIGGIGYGVHPDFRGRGYTARALRLLAPWAFDVAGFARLEAGAKMANVASQKAALAGGFAPDGVREARMRNGDGTFGDEARFALINPRLPRSG
jgi:RimJ/RimL family protein N-acetyltransferase